jgi:hypothetical protein
MQLGGMFRVALQVTDGVPAYATRRAAIQAYYDQHFADWVEFSEAYGADSVLGEDCGGGYHGKNIAFTPLFDWVRLETDPARKATLQTRVLRDTMWEVVKDHKNVWFAYIYASQADPSDNLGAVATAHTSQLEQFPQAPNLARGRDLRNAYPANDNCPDEPISSVAVDVGDRVPSIFMWERHPWTLVGPENLRFVFPGHDYLIAYWMGRRYGFIDDDTAGTCLVWR